MYGFNVRQLIVSLGNDAGNLHVDIQHHHHGNEEGPHGREYDVACVSVVSAHFVVVLSWFVPGNYSAIQAVDFFMGMLINCNFFMWAC